MTEYFQQPAHVNEPNNSTDKHSSQIDSENRPMDDDRYPGSFFRIPGVPKPGKTTWSLAK